MWDEINAQVLKTSLFCSLLKTDYTSRTETPGHSYENNEMQDCMWDEINAQVLPMENDDLLNDNEEMYELEKFDEDLTINLENEGQTFPTPSKPSDSIEDDQPVCNKSQLMIPALMIC